MKFFAILQTHPIGHEERINIYASLHNDPLNFRDPTGMITIDFANCETCGTNATRCWPGYPFKSDDQI